MPHKQQGGQFLYEHLLALLPMQYEKAEKAAPILLTHASNVTYLKITADSRLSWGHFYTYSRTLIVHL